MQTRASILILAQVLLATCLPAVAAASGVESIFRQYGFPPLSRLTHLCQQNVYPANNPGWHITWDAFASASTPSALVAEYRKKLGDAGFSRDGEGDTWRLPPNAAQVDRVLDITSSGAEGAYRNCARKPPAGSRSIIMVSKKT